MTFCSAFPQSSSLRRSSGGSSGPSRSSRLRLVTRPGPDAPEGRRTMRRLILPVATLLMAWCPTRSAAGGAHSDSPTPEELATVLVCSEGWPVLCEISDSAVYSPLGRPSVTVGRRHLLACD